MEIGVIGLGRMGGNIAANLVDSGHRVVAYDKNEKAVEIATGKGAKGVYSVAEFVLSLHKPRLVWLMVPPEYVDEVLSKVMPLLAEGDTVVDAGNSYYTDSQKRAGKLKTKGINFLDVGVSGGVEGARQGACLMIGGNKEVYSKYERVFSDLSVEKGYLHAGKAGAGHFSKMIHNGIEYGMMGAIGEGLQMLDKHKKELGLDVRDVVKVYNHGSIIESKLLNYAIEGMSKSNFKEISGKVPKGKTELEMEKLEKLGDMSVLKSARMQRVKSRKKSSYSGKIVSTMRNEFGGHAVKLGK